MEQRHEVVKGVNRPRWKSHLVGSGRLEASAGRLKFITGGMPSMGYTNAQLDDYQGLPRSHFPWTPPLTLTVRARFSHPSQQLRGTAGFGFWNDPLLMTQKRLPALPRAVWFINASEPSNMKLDIAAPGCGWKAACIDAQRITGLLWAPLAALLVPLMNVKPLYGALWPRIQHALRIRESILPVDMTQWHTYVLEWGRKYARFSLGGLSSETTRVILRGPAPRGPLGFVMWQDNQYLRLTPWGCFRWGTLDVTEPQWMEIGHLQIQRQEEAQA